MSAIYLLDNKGRVLLTFDYRGEVDFSIPDKFMSHLQASDTSQSPPVFRIDDWTFLFVTRFSLYFLIVTRSNSNAALLLVFLDSLAKLFSDYLGSPLSAELIVDNFTLIYELLDEVMDYGYPQTLDSKALSAYILREQPRESARMPTAVADERTGLVTWRAEGLEYNVNEVFADIVEKVNLLVGRNGSVIQNELIGEINLTCYLSGMPELRIGFNDVLLLDSVARPQVQTDVTRRLFELEDITFHQCVRLKSYETDRSITFIPPDGQFTLLKYRLSSTVAPIIKVTSSIEKWKGSRVELQVTARADFKKETVAQNVRVMVPVPRDVDSPKAQCSAGKMSYSAKDDTMVWTIKRMQGGQQFTLRAHFGLPSVESEDDDSRRPISVEFEIPFFTISGLRVQYLKVMDQSGYQATSWVRYVTSNGTYEFRT
jgi:AP-1 complex subunit mu